MPDLALSVKELSSRGSLLAKVLDVDVSACSHDFAKFNIISPSSSPHWPLEKGQKTLNLLTFVSKQSAYRHLI